MKLEMGKHNVIFLTLDSCRYDTAKRAKTPYMNSISPLMKGEAPATYTLPSHISFFSGILPNLINGEKYLDNIDQIWRSVHAKLREKKSAIAFEGKNIIDFYTRNNYNVIGAGGVSFFRETKDNLLPSFFSRFLHFSKGIKKNNSYARADTEFPLFNLDIIASYLDDKRPFFLFINCPETHIPYDCPKFVMNAQFEKIIEKMYSLDYKKEKNATKNIFISSEEREAILSAQKEALEWIDQQLELLVKKVHKNGLPTLVIALADHGEELGEANRYGHAHAHETVIEVPVWCGIVS